ncbi:MAG: T9SS type A sorting domain-containing protein, partial [Flavobacteriales bacterium]
NSDATVFVIAPNPATGSFSVNYGLQDADQAKLEIIAADGRAVYNTTLTTSGHGSLALDKGVIGNVPGLYLVRLTTTQGSATRRLIVE